LYDLILYSLLTIKNVYPILSKCHLTHLSILWEWQRERRYISRPSLCRENQCRLIDREINPIPPKPLTTVNKLLMKWSFINKLQNEGNWDKKTVCRNFKEIYNRISPWQPNNTPTSDSAENCTYTVGYPRHVIFKQLFFDMFPQLCSFHSHWWRSFGSFIAMHPALRTLYHNMCSNTI